MSDLDQIRKIEQELNITLRRLDELEWKSRNYTVNQDGAITAISLYKCNISDLTRIIAPLAALTQLTELILNDNQISDLKPLAALTQLTKLYLKGNQISDLKPLAALTQLTKLDLDNNWISDLTPLKHSLALQQLDLGYNPIKKLPKWITDFNMDILWTMVVLNFNSCYAPPPLSPPLLNEERGRPRPGGSKLPSPESGEGSGEGCVTSLTYAVIANALRLRGGTACFPCLVS